ncbi:hypothetical protein DXA22_09280 [Bifidobacterium pseudocatenulatum]|uniref:Uncharacterized protein n=1 Tax=Bifidobacterium pseudocatenulatum TaxID=28026 RepID=A0A413KAZ2_BIFPS|nr:hypothetical protein DXA22_09280 [Bifidobacterium pseudocatenulatum]
MSKNMTPTVEEFEAWTAEDEAKALQESAEAMNVKHIIRDGNVWFLAPKGHVYKLPLALSIDDFVRLSDLQSNSEQIQMLKGILETFAGEDAAKELSKEPAMVPFNILNAYGEVLARVQGVELGKSSTSAASSKEKTEVE